MINKSLVKKYVYKNDFIIEINKLDVSYCVFGFHNKVQIIEQYGFRTSENAENYAKTQIDNLLLEIGEK